MNEIKNFTIKNPGTETLVISAFPGVGKSYLYQKAKDKIILDSDSSRFDKSDFPENYIKHIKDNIGTCDIILVSSHKEVRDALVNSGIKFTLVYPNIRLKQEYISRYIKRGSPESFIKILSDNWDSWITDMTTQKNCLRLELGKGQYLSDIVPI